MCKIQNLFPMVRQVDTDFIKHIQCVDTYVNLQGRVPYLDVKFENKLLKFPFHHSSSPFHCLHTPSAQSYKPSTIVISLLCFEYHTIKKMYSRDRTRFTRLCTTPACFSTFLLICGSNFLYTSLLTFLLATPTPS